MPCFVPSLLLLVADLNNAELFEQGSTGLRRNSSPLCGIWRIVQRARISSIRGQSSVAASTRRRRACPPNVLLQQVVGSSDLRYDHPHTGEVAMAHLKLFVLGQPRLERDDGPIELN